MPARLARQLWLRMDHPDVRWLAGKVDVVHGPNYVVPPGGPAAEVVTVSDLSAIHFPEMCSPDVLEWPLLLRRALRRGAWVHTISHAVADEVRSLHPEAADRVVAVPLAVDRPPPPLPATSGRRGRYLAGGDRYVLSLGTAEPRKDLPGLVRAFDAVAARDGEVRLVLAGPDGIGTEALDEAIARSPHRGRIVRVGWVDDEARLALLRGARAVAYPSRYEGFGLVPLEAIAAGTPVVATATGAIPEVLGDGGLLVPPGDVDALAGAIHRVLTDEQVVSSLLRRGSARVDAYSWSETVGGIVDLYRTALAAKRSPS
jgi:glycosyltransferase involved in cell wall biosynthesis